MRYVMLTGLGLLATIVASGTPVRAQTTAQPSIDLKIEQKRQRTIVAPPADAGASASEADRAADKLDEQRRAEELRKKAVEPSAAPQLDESVVEGIRGKQLQELPKR